MESQHKMGRVIMLAIVIPYYNPYFFEATLQSLVAQRDKRFRVYIGDDCSTRSPNLLLQKYKGQLNITYHRFDTNLGQESLTRHWVRCITLTETEDWLMILGDDDVLGSDVVASFYKVYEDIKSLEVDVVRYASVVINEKGEEISQVYTHPELELSTDAYYKTFIKESRSSLSEYVFSRRAYNTYGFRDYALGWYSDTMAWLEFSAFGTIYSLNASIVYIRTSPFSITGTGVNYLQKYQSGYCFFKDVLSFRPKRFTKTQRHDFILSLQDLGFKLKLLQLSHWVLIVRFWLKDLYLKQAIRFTINFFKRKIAHG